jgi:hypothetical protein
MRKSVISLTGKRVEQSNRNLTGRNIPEFASMHWRKRLTFDMTADIRIGI